VNNITQAALVLAALLLGTSVSAQAQKQGGVLRV
jgi:hypothetical protein